MWCFPMDLKTALFLYENEFLETRDAAQARKRMIDRGFGPDWFRNRCRKHTLLLGTSGRYEFRNKGMDLFIDALGELNKKKDCQW